MGFTGTLKLQYREEAKNQTVLFGTSFPSTTTGDLRGHASGCTGQYNNMSSKCYCSIPWVLEVPDGCLLRADDMISLPRVNGKFSVYAPRTILLRPSVDHVYDVINMEGGDPDNTGLHFELFPGEKFMVVGHKMSNEIQVYRVDMKKGTLDPVGDAIPAWRPLCFKFR
jgi:hypothetical protein